MATDTPTDPTCEAVDLMVTVPLGYAPTGDEPIVQVPCGKTPTSVVVRDGHEFILCAECAAAATWVTR